ncbi:MAG: hypothetical protein J1E40_12770 [Oscillospiraceae bacterium]|nr:hypothetical protein [Oscillospiraceae bacterium]
MNEYDIMKAMNGVEEQFVSEYTEFTPRKGISIKRVIKTSIIIAAAAAFVIPAGAYVYSEFIHRDNVEHYITGTELIEEQSPDAVKNYVMENNDYRITIDSALSDGHNVMMVLTNDAKTIKGLEIKAWTGGLTETYITYADGSAGPFKTIGQTERPMTGMSGYAYDDYDKSPIGFDRRVSIFSCRDIDLNKDVKIEFFIDVKGRHSAELYYWRRDYPELLKSVIPDFDLDEEITNDLDGMEFITSFAPNVKCVPLYAEDGTEIFMSAFEVFSENGRTLAGENNIIDPWSFFFITNDGEKIPLNFENYNIKSREDCDYVIFGDFIDPDEYQGIEVNGIRYLKQE